MLNLFLYSNADEFWIVDVTNHRLTQESQAALNFATQLFEQLYIRGIYIYIYIYVYVKCTRTCTYTCTYLSSYIHTIHTHHTYTRYT